MNAAQKYILTQVPRAAGKSAIMTRDKIISHVWDNIDWDNFFEPPPEVAHRNVREGGEEIFCSELDI